ncbi:MAG TPA: hypothetical protein VGE47_15610 [Burkholderiaceae bacterium]
MLLLRTRHALAALLCALAGSAHAATTPCDGSPSRLPERAPAAPGAAALLKTWDGFDGKTREQAIRRELLAGNVPRFLRTLQPVSVEAQLAGLGTVRLIFCVLPDYLSLGNDADFLRVPMGLDTALAVAGTFGFVLPTRRMVDLIYRQSAVQLEAQPLPPGEQMHSNAYYQRHQEMVQVQRAGFAKLPADALVAGHKKDLVLSARLWERPGRVAIYGWQRADGEPIQPLSTVHSANYADYSHGVRLVSNVAYVNGAPRSLFEILGDARLAALISDEGSLPAVRALFEVAPLAGQPEAASGVAPAR